jgi:inhibitor of cysteine peptidase
MTIIPAMERNMRAAIACLSLAAAISGAGAADQTLKLSVGQQTLIELEENPSTGYRWVVDAKASVNASILRIDDRGFSQNTGGKPLLGAPGTHRWSIEATSAGNASISFVYGRSWEAAVLRTHQVTIQVAPQ